MIKDFFPASVERPTAAVCAEKYRIGGNITEIIYLAQHPAAVHSITFVPVQNHTITVDGKNRAVFVPVSDTAETAYLIAYDKKLTIEFNPYIPFDFKLGKCTLTFAEKGADEAPNEEGITVMIESDFGDQKISDLQIVKYGIRQ